VSRAVKELLVIVLSVNVDKQTPDLSSESGRRIMTADLSLGAEIVTAVKANRP